VEDIEPLEPAIWFQAIRKLFGCCDVKTAEELEMLLRHGYHLLQLTPRPLREVIGSDTGEVEFEELLATGAFDSAADRLVGPLLAYSVRRLRPGLYEAEIRLPGQDKASVARGSSIGLAVVRAWRESLLTLEERAAMLTEGRLPDLRTTPAELHLRLI
jgi:hypothetical protein